MRAVPSTEQVHGLRPKRANRLRVDLFCARRVEEFDRALLEILVQLQIFSVLRERDAHGGQSPCVFENRIERDRVCCDRQRRRVARRVNRVQKPCPHVLLELTAPRRSRFFRHAGRAHQCRIRNTEIKAATAVQSELRIELVVFLRNARHDRALVGMDLVFELTACEAASVEHEVLADHAARIRQAVRKAIRL